MFARQDIIRMEQLRRAVQLFAGQLPEVQAREVASVYPEYKPGQIYKSGQYVTCGADSNGDGMIYFKRFNPNSGGAEFFDFSVQPPPQAQQTAPMAQGYDPRGDIEALRGDFNTLRGELEEMKKAGQKRTGGKAAET